MKIYLASDHGGFTDKEAIQKYLEDHEHEVVDMGADSLNPEDDYTDFVLPLAEKVAHKTNSIGIILGRTGNGEAIAANKVKGIRAAVCLKPEMARIARLDNHANVLSIGADFVNTDEVFAVVQAFIDTKWSEEPRHVRRVEKIIQYEHSNN